MLEALRLINFQRHRKLVVRFDERLTTIVGETDRGKSSIMRALRWVMLNEAPSDLTHHGETRVEADLKVDGCMVKRVRGKTRNEYSMDGKQFVAFGATVPPAIAKLLRVSATNIQEQHDAHFWFAERKSDVSRQLNAIVNLGVIDDILADSAQLLRRTKDHVEVSRERVHQYKAAVQELAYVDDVNEDLCCAEEAQARSTAATARRQALERCLAAVASRQALTATAGTLLGDLEALALAGREHEKRQTRWLNLGTAINKLAVRLVAQKATEADYFHAHQTFHAEVDGHTCPVCKGKGHL